MIWAVGYHAASGICQFRRPLTMQAYRIERIAPRGPVAGGLRNHERSAVGLPESGGFRFVRFLRADDDSYNRILRAGGRG